MPRLLRATAFVHELLRAHLRPGDRAIDATCGRGFDTMLLAECVGEQGHVWALDIQREALESTGQRLKDAGLESRVALLEIDHATLRQHLKEPCQAVVFNLGYLPHGDKACVTRPESSKAALIQALELLTPKGIATVTVYAGHPGGREEADVVDAYVRKLSQEHYAVCHYGFVNQVNDPPYVYVIEKR